jgi:hypothetical protein
MRKTSKQLNQPGGRNATHQPNTGNRTMKQPTNINNAKTLLVALRKDAEGKWQTATKKTVTHKVTMNRTVTGSWTHGNVWFIPETMLGKPCLAVHVGNNLNGSISDIANIADWVAHLLNTHNHADITTETW